MAIDRDWDTYFFQRDNNFGEYIEIDMQSTQQVQSLYLGMMREQNLAADISIYVGDTPGTDPDFKTQNQLCHGPGNHEGFINCIDDPTNGRYIIIENQSDPSDWRYLILAEIYAFQQKEVAS